MSNNAYFLHASQAMKAISDKMKNRTPPERNGFLGEIPKFTNTLIDDINVDQNISKDNGPTAVITVQPDFRNIFLTLSYHITILYDELKVKNNPILTPPSLMAYCLGLIYGYALLNDCKNIRRQSSNYANDFMSSQQRRNLQLLLSRCYVPDFVKPIIVGLNHCDDPRRSKLRYVYEFSCFDITFDYGRTLPISMYLKAHDLLATVQANRPPADTMHDWFNFEVIQGPISLRVGNIIGTGQVDGNYMSWFSLPNLALFNPLTGRFNTSRPTLARMPTPPYNTDEGLHEVNPYIYLLNASTRTIQHTINFFQTMSKVIIQQNVGKSSLGSLLNEVKGNQIMSHYITGPTLPTYHGSSIHQSDTDKFSDEFAATARFMNGGPTTFNTVLPYPTVVQHFRAGYYSVGNTVQHDPLSDPNKYKNIDIQSDVTPDIRHFCPIEPSTDHIFYNTITGKLIETAELDGSSVPQPNPSNELKVENSQFLQSAIPFNLIRTHQHICQHDIQVLQRAKHTTDLPKVHVDLYDRSKNIYPQIGRNIFDPNVPANLPGFVHQEHIGEVDKASTSLCYKAPIANHAPTTQAKKRGLYIWSSYRYYNYGQHSNRDPIIKKYMLTNFRTDYGTNITLVETPHPSIIIPSA